MGDNFENQMKKRLFELLREGLDLHRKLSRFQMMLITFYKSF